MRNRKLCHVLTGTMLGIWGGGQFVIAQDLLLQRIYNSLVENHYCGQTGLYLSFYKTGDRKLSQESSTYDQGALGLLLLELGEWERARGIVSFFAQEWEDGPSRDYREGVQGLANFYNAVFGGDGIEKTIHVGPNVWVGTLAARYVRKTGDARYWPFARDMALWIGKTIPHKDGGVAMGTVEGADGVPWPGVFSTENNLSYYAYLSELEKNQFASAWDKKFFAKEKKGVENWLVKVAFDKQNGCMNRGYNPFGVDKVRALDTHTWLVSAVGPERMLEIGLDPDKILSYAQANFVATVNGLKGVDFTDAAEARRVVASGPERPQGDEHRLVWLEGLGQYIAALRLMSDYHVKAGGEALSSFRAGIKPYTTVGHKDIVAVGGSVALYGRNPRAGHMAKAEEYRQLADNCVSEFEKASIVLEIDMTGYPYSWPQYGKTFVDGWHVPKPGNEGYVSALIASVWKGFAEIGYDPLADKYVEHLTKPLTPALSPKGRGSQRCTLTLTLSHRERETRANPHPSRERVGIGVGGNSIGTISTQVLFGASCDMASRAWKLLDEGRYPASFRQAQALIEEWSGFADQLQFKKERDVGEIICYDGSLSSRKKIFSYWALNDVGAALYIMARAGHEAGDAATVKVALEKLLTHYRLAQVWDVKGWFWSPLEAVREEFINYLPDTYGYLASLYEMQPALKDESATPSPPETRVAQLPTP